MQEVNAEQWTRIIVQTERPARRIGQQKQLRSPSSRCNTKTVVFSVQKQRKARFCVRRNGVSAGRTARFLFPDRLRPPDRRMASAQ